MKRIWIFILSMSLLILITGCSSTKETKILNFKAKDVESVEVYKFNIPIEAKGMIIKENEDIEKIINAFSEIEIKGDATDFNISGGEVTSFRFNLKDGEEFTVAHWEGILRNLENINYKVSSSETLISLWDKLDYEKNDVNESELPIINK